MVSRFGDDENFRRKSAQSLAMLILTISGTPFIYQGAELGMTNYPFSDISEFRDVQSINQFREKVDRGEVEDFSEVKEEIGFWSRDNARTPMQWSAQVNAGFSAAEPWLPVAPDYREVNVESQRDQPRSMLSLYRQLISLRRGEPALEVGAFDPVEAEGDVLAYIRRATESESRFSSGMPPAARFPNPPRHGKRKQILDCPQSRPESASAATARRLARRNPGLVDALGSRRRASGGYP